VNTTQVKITFSIPEKYATLIKNNSTLTFTTAGNNKIFTAKIYALEPAIEQATRTLQIRAIADNKDGLLLPGTFATISLPLEELNNAILIPTESIIPIQNGKKVFITENGKAKEIIIETANRTEKEILVTSGLKVGDTLITSGIMAIKVGAPVNLKLTQN
jgi:membrane fusion protein (multidrug efflux system)